MSPRRPKPLPVPRNTELGLLLLVVLITGAAYVLASLGQDAVIPANVAPFMGIVLAVLLVAHVVVRRLAPFADPTLLPLAGLLNGLGFVMIARVKQDLAWQQATWTLVGMVLFCFTLIIVRRARDLDRYRWTMALIGIVLLMLPMVPGLGVEIGGAKVWVRLPGNLTFQPGEPAKIALAIFFASYLVEKRELLGMAGRKVGPFVLPELRHLAPVLLAWGASMLVLINQKDLGSSMLFFAVFITMLWVATQRTGYLVVGTSLFAVGAYGCYKAFSHVQIRVDTWLDPWIDPEKRGYQLLQGQFTMAGGGVPGSGLGLSGTLQHLPAAESDFIFAVIAGELGLVGAVIVLTAFLLIIGAGLRISLRSYNQFDKLLAAGLTTLIGIQAFIIIGGVTRLLPLTGITLPFVSYGGTSLVANYVLIALLMRISDEMADRPVVSTRDMVPV